jgi:hypothetical protein
VKKSTRTIEDPEQGLASFQREERGPGGWPTDPQIAFIEAKYKLDKARKELARWRSNHANIARRLRHVEGGVALPHRPSARQETDTDPPANWRLRVSDKNIELYMELMDQPRAISAAETRMLVELVDAWRDLEHRKRLALERDLMQEPRDKARR